MEGLEDEELISPDTHVVVVASNKNIERYPFCLGDDPSHIVYNDPAPKTPSWSSIKGVTPTKLIELITTIHFHDTSFIQDVLLTYRDFITPTEFINLCLKRYEGPSEGSSTEQQRAIWEKDKNFVKSSMLIIIHKWLATLCKTDFLVSPTSTEPNNLTEGVTTFINATPDSYHTELFTLLFSAKKRTHSALNSSNSNPNSSPSQNRTAAPPGSVGGVTSGSTTMRFALNKPPPSSNNKTMSPNLTNHEISEPTNGSFSPEHISNELTLIEHELIKAISPLEFSKQAWNKSQKEILAPNILAFTEWFNRTSRWICTKIVSKDHPTLRAMIVEGFIAIGIMCLELRNFNGVMVTLSALHNSAIARLKQTWAMVNPKTLADFQSLSSLLSPDKNFKAYRPLLKEAANSPCIPYLGLFLTDYTFMDELPVFLSEHEGLLNVERILMIGGRLKEFMGYQHHHYDIKSRESIRAAILSERVWEDNEIFNMSKLREDSSNTSSANGNNPSPNSQNTAIDANNLTSAYVTVRLKKGALNEMRMQLTGTDLPSSVRHILTNREWNLISTGSYEETYSNGDVIVNVGDISKNIFRVLSGVVKMERTSDKPIDGESAHIFTAVAQPGQAIGEMVLFNNQVSPVKITALGSVTLQVFHIPMIRKVLEFDSVLNATFYKAIAYCFAYRVVHQIGACVGQPIVNNASNSRLTSSLPPTITTTPPQTPPLNLDEKLPLDIEFQSRFSLPDDEIPIKSYNTKTGSATGILYLSKHHICFYGTVFGVSKSKKYHYNHINQVAKTTDPVANELTSLVIVKEGAKKNSRKYVFKTPHELSQCYGIVFGLWKIHHKEFLPALPSSPGAKSLDTDLPSKEDWAILLKGAKRSTYKQGEIIVNEGSELQKLYVVLKGECSVERSLNDNGEFVSPFEVVNRMRSLSKGEGEDQSAAENSNLNSLTNYANRGARSMEALDLRKLKSAVSSTPDEGGGRLLQRTESGFIARGAQSNNINVETHKILTRDNNSKREIVATIQEDEVFGIESFLLNYPAVGRLVAETDEVEVGALEISVINVLLSLKQQLASKFYKYLAITLYKRINHSISPPSNSSSRRNSCIATPKLGSIPEMTPLKTLSANIPSTLVMLEEEEMIMDGNQLVASTTLR